jgi:hypothetical protein
MTWVAYLIAAAATLLLIGVVGATLIYLELMWESDP